MAAMPSEEISDADIIDVDDPTVRDLVPVRADVATITTTALMRPVGNVEQIVEAFAQYQSLRKRLIVASDVQTIQGKEFVKKSGWRKIATAFGINVEYRDENLTLDDDGNVTNCRVHARAVAPNGRFFDAVGVCDRYERCCRERLGKDECRIKSNKHYHCVVGCDGLNHFSKPQHDIPATASTRAANRCIADLVGFGEVSAEEIDRDVIEPLTAEQANELIVALNRIADETQRKGAKIGFVHNFGKPQEMTTDRLEQARAWITAAGGSFVADDNPTVEATEPLAGEAGAQPSPASDQSTAGEAPPNVIVADHGRSASPPSDPTAAARPSPAVVAPSPSAGEGNGGDAGPVDAAAGPAPVPGFDGPPAAATQKRDIAMFCDRLGIDKPDKELICLFITKNRTSTTTEMSKREAAAMLAALRHMNGGTVALEEAEIDGVMMRVLVAKNPVGEAWLAPYVNGEER